MKINIASNGGFQCSIQGSACNQKPRGDSILVGGTTQQDLLWPAMCTLLHSYYTGTYTGVTVLLL